MLNDVRTSSHDSVLVKYVCGFNFNSDSAILKMNYIYQLTGLTLLNASYALLCRITAKPPSTRSLFRGDKQYFVGQKLVISWLIFI